MATVKITPELLLSLCPTVEDARDFMAVDYEIDRKAVMEGDRVLRFPREAFPLPIPLEAVTLCNKHGEILYTARTATRLREKVARTTSPRLR